MSKLKLLITLGCSYTEGVGCWVDETPLDLNHIPIDNQEWYHWYKLSIDKFHEFGYPNHLGKLLGYDKVINLGYGGSSPSGNTKHLFNLYKNTSFENDSVTLFWWVPSPQRISFYVDKKIRNISNGDSLWDEYVKLIENHDDTLFEQLFYIDIVEMFCKSKGIDLIFFAEEANLYSNIASKETWLGLLQEDVLGLLQKDDTSQICTHPNEKGYEKISIAISNAIKDKFPHLTYSPKDTIEWEYKGTPERLNLNNMI